MFYVLKCILCFLFNRKAEYIYDTFPDSFLRQSYTHYYARFIYCPDCDTIKTFDNYTGHREVIGQEKKILLSKLHKEYVEALGKEVYVIKEDL